MAKGNHRAALSIFEQAEKIAPASPDVLLRISQQCSDMIAETKVPAEAQRLAMRSLDYAKRGVALAPDNAKAHLALSVAYGRMTDFVNNRTRLEYSRLIKSEAERAAQLDPREDYAFHVLGRWHYGVANLNPLLKVLAKAVYGGLPNASNEEAVRLFKMAIEIAPQRIIHHHELARVYGALGKRDLARKEWQIVINLQPHDREDQKAQKEARAALKQRK